MATLPRKPNVSAPSAATPVGGARARELQERIRVLRGMAEEARTRLRQADDRNRHERQAELEHAERACRQAEQQMAELRARAHAAGPVPAARHDPRHPAQELPPEALLRIVRPAATTGHPLRQVHDLDAGNPDLDLLWNRNEAANTALDLLQRASEPQFDTPVILRTELPLGSAPDTGLSPSEIDFGPLIEDFSPVRHDADSPPARAEDDDAGVKPGPPHPVARKASRSNRDASRPDPAPVQGAAVGKTHPVQAGEPVRPRRPTTQAARGRRVFRPALLAGLLLGIVLVYVLIRLAPQLPAFAGPGTSPSPAAPVAQPAGTPARDRESRWRRMLLQQEQAIRQAAHARFLALRDRLRHEAAAPVVVPGTVEIARAETQVPVAVDTPAAGDPQAPPLSRAAGPAPFMGPPPPPAIQGPVQVLF